MRKLVGCATLVSPCLELCFFVACEFKDSILLQTSSPYSYEPEQSNSDFNRKISPSARTD